MAGTNPIELQKALKNAHYPTDKQHLVEVARKNRASNDVVEKISDLKKDRFDSPADVQEAVFRSK
ncbi:DUF2795 domain-containing protein [Streptomyces sp. NPDC052396]|uniref:DUF2795 domain-containing protein n=1 Tax=Streptomyces sp. NPDC052396 TaxID=3365689 RepID=UPI0037D8EBE9